MDITSEVGVIDKTDTMYPCTLHKIEGKQEFEVPACSSVYGIVLHGTMTIDQKILTEREYFCITGDGRTLYIDGTVGLIVRHGFRGQNTVGGPIEKTGRLCYVDNCSDSVLVYPPRQGDSMMNLLSFAPEVVQRWHLHPSIRLGIVVEGHGIAESRTTGTHKIEPGMVFCMNEREVHRFITTDSVLNIISFHPDGDWGPTDDNHAMLNRTYDGRFVN
jgi:hypothetical protein